MPFGTEDLDAPVTRADFERALRHLNVSHLDLRDTVLQLAARVVALTDELTRRLDGVEPVPAPPGTPAAPPTQTVEAAVDAAIPEAVLNVRAGDTATPTRVDLDLGGDKYAARSATPPCDELLPICQARCCKLSFALSTADLDEGVIRFDYGQPYLIRQRHSDGYCVHNDPDTRGCTVHAQRPRVCRVYDCRDDDRIWADYDKRIPAEALDPKRAMPNFDLAARARARYHAMVIEKKALSETFADDGPRPGPDAKPRAMKRGPVIP